MQKSKDLARKTLFFIVLFNNLKEFIELLIHLHY